ncbi:MAG: helix-turn-helix domain-containing protein [Azoarcus sp.]|jgi:transcriptional regulator with XRE-family HTH domain|nr:helix-turn-helix domain-containing protein [Azoarcus sp.]
MDVAHREQGFYAWRPGFQLPNAGEDAEPRPFIFGTGSVLDVFRREVLHMVEARTSIKVVMDDSQAARLDLRRAPEHLANIKQALKPSISDLAAVFGVSRQAVYKWMNGEATPEPGKSGRISKLSEVADAFRDAQIRHAHAIVKMKAFNSQSLLDLVAADRLEKSHIDNLIDESRKMDAAYDRSSMAKSNAKPTDDWLATASIPGHPE